MVEEGFWTLHCLDPASELPQQQMGHAVEDHSEDQIVESDRIHEEDEAPSSDQLEENEAPFTTDAAAAAPIGSFNLAVAAEPATAPTPCNSGSVGCFRLSFKVMSTQPEGHPPAWLLRGLRLTATGSSDPSGGVEDGPPAAGACRLLAGGLAPPAGVFLPPQGEWVEVCGRL